MNDCKTIFAAHRAQRATNSTQQQPLMAHDITRGSKIDYPAANQKSASAKTHQHFRKL
jgi:hypothetical protein